MDTQARSEAAADFLRLAARGDVQAAFDRYVDEAFQHHNPYFPGDRQALLLAMQQSAQGEPNRSFDVQRVIASGHHVVVHSRLVREDGAEFAVVHICRFECDRIVELWDLAQPVPRESPNEHGMF